MRPLSSVIARRPSHDFGHLPTGLHTPFARYVRWLHSKSALTSPSVGEDPGISLPAPLPFLPADFSGAAPSGGRRWCRLRQRARAMGWTNHVLSFYNFGELGCPKTEEGHGAAPLSRSRGLLAWADAAVGEILEFGRLGLGPQASPSGGRPDALARDLDHCARTYGGGAVITAGRSVTQAIPVVAASAALPEVAWVLRPASVLAAERAAVLEDLGKLVFNDEHVRGPRIFAGHKIDPIGERALYARLLMCVAAVLVPASQIPQVGGRALAGGFFAVSEGPKSSEQLLIFDRRPQNRRERRISWLQLPSAAQLTRLAPSPGECFVGAGEDLQCYYYYLGHEDAWVARNAVGRSVPKRDYLKFGASRLVD